VQVRVVKSTLSQVRAKGADGADND